MLPLLGSIPGQETKILQAMWYDWKIKTKQKNRIGKWLENDQKEESILGILKTMNKLYIFSLLSRLVYKKCCFIWVWEQEPETEPCPFIYKEHLIYRLNCLDWGYSVGKPEKEISSAVARTPLLTWAREAGRARRLHLWSPLTLIPPPRRRLKSRSEAIRERWAPGSLFQWKCSSLEHLVQEIAPCSQHLVSNKQSLVTWGCRCMESSVQRRGWAWSGALSPTVRTAQDSSLGARLRPRSQAGVTQHRAARGTRLDWERTAGLGPEVHRFPWLSLPPPSCFLALLNPFLCLSFHTHFPSGLLLWLSW